jgi:hypothetical protein
MRSIPDLVTAQATETSIDPAFYNIPLVTRLHDVHLVTYLPMEAEVWDYALVVLPVGRAVNACLVKSQLKAVECTVLSGKEAGIWLGERIREEDSLLLLVDGGVEGLPDVDQQIQRGTFRVTVAGDACTACESDTGI